MTSHITQALSPVVSSTQPNVATGTTATTLISTGGNNERCIAIRSSRENMSSWYTSVDVNNDASRIAQEAFQQALKFFEKDLKIEKKTHHSWLQSKTNISDVLEVVDEAKTKYEQRKSKTSRWMSKTSEILNMCSSRVVYYSSVLDVLAQHHPEYVSLAWGAMKFLFVITINHEEHIIQIASALSKISDLLPQISMLARLYPISEMQMAVANLYSQIMRFCVKAAAWYKQKKTRHAITAILKPFSLEFKDILSQIESQSQNMRHIADIAAQAELRDLHLTVRHLESKYIQQSFGPESSQPQVDVLGLPSRPKTILPPSTHSTTIEDIRKYLISNAPNPAECYQLGCVLRQRRRARGAFNPSQAWISDILRNWASEPNSAILRIKSTIVTKDASKDFALDMIQLAQTMHLPVIWTLNTPLDASTKSISEVDVIKSLIDQALNQHPGILTTLPRLEKSRFQLCVSIEDWIGLFVEILSRIPRMLIVLDTSEELALAMKQLGRFWQQIISPNISTWVKFILVGHECSSDMLLKYSSGSAENQILDLDKGRRPGAGRGVLRPMRRGQRGNGASAELLKPYLLRSIKDSTA